MSGRMLWIEKSSLALRLEQLRNNRLRGTVWPSRTAPEPVKWRRALELFKDTGGPGSDFRTALTDALRTESKMDAAFWECKPVTVNSLDTESFEFVVIPTSALLGPASPADFANKLNDPSLGRIKDEIRAFPNLSGDSVLVVPTVDDLTANTRPGLGYGHLLGFLRSASEKKIMDLWKAVGETMDSRLKSDAINGKKVWLSTSGTGVPWLHVRLDSWPKYYVFDDYKENRTSTRDQ